MRKNSQKKLCMGLLHANFKEILEGKNFYIAVFFNVFILALTFLSKRIQSGGDWGDGVCHHFFDFLYFGMLPKLIILISSLPVVAGFCSDWNSKYGRFAAGRIGISQYLKGKVFTCMSGTFMTCFLSLFIFTLFLLVFMPISTEVDISNLGAIYPFGSLISQSPYLYQFIRIICFSSFCSVWSVCGLALSAYLPNKYVVYASSFVIYYMIEQIYNNKISDFVPSFFQLPYLGITALTTPMFENAVLDFIYIHVLFGMLIFLAGKVFLYGAERRMHDELI